MLNACLQRAYFLHACVEGNVFILGLIPDYPDRIFALLDRLDGFSDHVAQHDDALIGRAKMLFRPIVNGALTFLGNTILIMRRDSPPAVFHALVHPRLIILKPSNPQNERFVSLLLGIGIEPQPKSERVRVVHRNPESDRVVGLSALARGRMPRVRRKNPM